MNTIILAVGTVLCGIAYRAGGASWGKSWMRDVGCSLIMCIMPATFKLTWLLIPAFGLMWLALTTYHYFLPKPKDYTAPYYALHGFMVSLAVFPYIFATGDWGWFALRCVVCAGAMYGWYYVAKWNDNLHEFGRGAILAGSTVILCL